jgi:hypothetical protein
LRKCNGDDLDDRVLMPKLATKSDVVSPMADRVELQQREFLVMLLDGKNKNILARKLFFQWTPYQGSLHWSSQWLHPFHANPSMVSASPTE